MAALIKLSELKIPSRVLIRFPFLGMTEDQAQAIMRGIIREEWPEQKRPNQSVYVIRLVGDVAVAYRETFSPVIYIGRGNAFGRLYGHTEWLASLLIAVPQLGVEIRIVGVARKNNPTLYENIEADLLHWFSEDHGAVPWFNRRRERGREGHYDYTPEARRALRQIIGIRQGTRYRWAIRPTKNNDQFEPYEKGMNP